MPKRRQRAVRTAARSAAEPAWLRGLDRLLSCFDDAPGVQLSKLAAFESILLLIAAAEPWTRALRTPGSHGLEHFAPALLTTVLAALALLPRWRRPAFAALALAQIASIWADFPARGNHAYLEAGFFSLAALLDREQQEDRRLYLRAVGWLVCVIFFYAGVQKLVQGYYLHGQYLAFALAKESYQPILRPLLESAEYDRLVALPGKLGDGPYLVSSPLFLAVSNLVWITEIALAPLFLLRRTRVLAVFVALLLIVAIEVGARELFFGFVYVDALLLVLPGAFNRRVVVPCAVVMVVLVLIRLGVLPGITFY